MIEFDFSITHTVSFYFEETHLLGYKKLERLQCVEKNFTSFIHLLFFCIFAAYYSCYEKRSL